MRALSVAFAFASTLLVLAAALDATRLFGSEVRAAGAALPASASASASALVSALASSSSVSASAASMRAAIAESMRAAIADVATSGAIATFGTAELSAAAVEALGESRACLLANHGLVTLGPDLDAAFRIACEIEAVAEYWWRAKSIGDPTELTPAEMNAAIERFKDYGHPNQ